MMQLALLGVDVGTTNIKAVAFGLDGAELTKTSCPTPSLTPRPGSVEYDVETLWNSVCQLLRDLQRTLPPDTECRGIAFTGMAEAGVALDANGTVLSRAISWLDTRTVDELGSWDESVGAERTATITGLPLSTAAGVLRLLWLRTHEREAFAATRRWLNLPDYCAYKLCGAQATDYSLASRMMTFDLTNKQWSSSICDAVEIPPTLFGECVPSGTRLGLVTADAADQTGLPIDLPVIAGGHDHVCAAFALGLTEPGDILDSIGTAEAMCVTLNEPVADANIAAKGIAQGIHVAPNRSYAMSGLFMGGGTIDWLRSVLLENSQTDTDFAELLQFAAAIEPATDDPFFLAHLKQANPPLFDPMSRAAFVGLRSDHKTGQMVRAVLEGLACEYHRLAESVFDSFSIKPRRLTATGGGTKIRLLLEMKAGLAGMPIEVPDVSEATAFGAALLAGIGTETYRNAEDARDQIVMSATQVNATPAQSTLLLQRYNDIYSVLYDALRPVNQQIAAAQ